MKKQWLLTCMTALLLSHTSCMKEENVLETSSIESRNQEMEQKVQNLVQQARQGKTEAYKSLAYCYRDGKGVEKSYMNAIFMYLVYCQKTGQDLKASMELFEEESPYRLLIEILSSPVLDKETKEKIAQFQQLAPADAKAIMAMVDFCMDGRNNNVLKTLQEAESEGSELARALQVFYYEENKDTTMYYRYLNCPSGESNLKCDQSLPFCVLQNSKRKNLKYRYLLYGRWQILRKGQPNRKGR